MVKSTLALIHDAQHEALLKEIGCDVDAYAYVKVFGKVTDYQHQRNTVVDEMDRFLKICLV